MLNQLLFKLSRIFSVKPLFDYPVEKQRKYIGKFRDPRSLVERSFYQYKSQMSYRGCLGSFVLNCVSLPVWFIYLLLLNKKINTEKADAVFVSDGNLPSNNIPSSLTGEFKEIKVYSAQNNFLTTSDRVYIFKLFLRYPLSWHFLLKSTVKIMRYSWIFKSFSPRALIVNNEYSFTSTMLTDYCNQNGVELINVMHGEKLFDITDSFFAFNRCYIWHEFYRDLFIEERAEPNQFIVELPPSMLFSSSGVNKTVDFTYYLQDQKEDKLKVIVDKLNQLVKSGKTVAIRPHPRFTNLNELNACLGDANIEVENCKEISIEHSILRTNNVISVYSTVLQQGYYNGVNVVIDDVSDPIMFSKLVEHKYVMLMSKHRLLSNIHED